MAERVGFEPTVRGYRTPDFESGSFDHSDTSPLRKGVRPLLGERGLTPFGSGGDIGNLSGDCQVRKMLTARSRRHPVSPVGRQQRAARNRPC